MANGTADTHPGPFAIERHWRNLTDRIAADFRQLMPERDRARGGRGPASVAIIGLAALLSVVFGSLWLLAAVALVFFFMKFNLPMLWAISAMVGLAAFDLFTTPNGSVVLVVLVMLAVAGLMVGSGLRYLGGLVAAITGAVAISPLIPDGRFPLEWVMVGVLWVPMMFRWCRAGSVIASAIVLGLWVIPKLADVVVDFASPVAAILGGIALAMLTGGLLLMRHANRDEVWLVIVGFLLTVPTWLIYPGAGDLTVKLPDLRLGFATLQMAQCGYLLALVILAGVLHSKGEAVPEDEVEEDEPEDAGEDEAEPEAEIEEETPLTEAQVERRNELHEKLQEAELDHDRDPKTNDPVVLHGTWYMKKLRDLDTTPEELEQLGLIPEYFMEEGPRPHRREDD